VGTFIAGISGTIVSGPDVVVNGAGKLGVVVSSARYKKDVKDMGALTNSLMKLRPVTFKYKNDDQGNTQYGLIAEEVEKLYPELVTYDNEEKVETVRYSMLTSMLLNEVQKQDRENAKQAEQTRQLTADLAAAQQQNARLTSTFEQRLSNLEHVMRAQNGGDTHRAGVCK